VVLGIVIALSGEQLIERGLRVIQLKILEAYRRAGRSFIVVAAGDDREIVFFDGVD
jgi:hypothetical protein